MSLWVKICANTNLQDALLAAELGADAVGFVFAPSKRQVTPQQVAEITPHLPPHIQRVGVFTTEDYDEIIRTVEIAGLDAVQLHAGLNLSLAQRLTGLTVIQTIHIKVASIAVEGIADHTRTAAALAEAAAAQPDGHVLVDSKIGSTSGGSGIAFNWSQARATLQTQPHLRVIVAGGLNPQNVGEAIRELTPWGVDVASGVESEPGRKDPEKLKRFIENARLAAARV